MVVQLLEVLAGIDSLIVTTGVGGTFAVVKDGAILGIVILVKDGSINLN